MNILMVTDFYWPYEGGVEQHVRRLSYGLAERGHSVAVATLGHGDLAHCEADGLVRVYRLRGMAQRSRRLFAHAHRPWAPPCPDPEVTLGLRAVIQAVRPHVVHGHDWLARSFLPLKASSGARLVMSLHYYTLACAKKSLTHQGSPCAGPGVRKCLACAAQHYGMAKGVPVALANWIAGAFERQAVDAYLPVSHATVAGNGLTPGDRYEVIPNFTPERAPAGDVQGYLAQLPAEPFVLFVGDLRRDKGIEVLLEAYAGMADAPPLVLIGKVWSESPQVFPPNVLVLHDWPNAAVLAAWERSLMGIVPSLWPEPFGIVIIEAMAAGRPVVASRVGGIPEVVEDGVDGLLVAPADALALRQAIGRLLDNAELRQRLGRAAREKAARYRSAEIVARIEDVYARVLRGRSEAHDTPHVGQHHYQQP